MEEDKTNKKKFYCYVDESGQDTEGKLFVVATVIIEDNRDEITNLLEGFEKKSQRGQRKWIKSRSENQEAYIRQVIGCEALKGRLFYTIFNNTTDYLQCTVSATALAIPNVGEAEYKATILVDGLPKSQTRKFGARLRRLGVQTRKVRGIRKEEADALLRLADAICGLVRSSQRGKSNLAGLLEQALEAEIIKKLDPEK